MSPISQERVDFLTDRIKVLTSMYGELIAKPSKYYVQQAQARELMQIALNNIQAEKITLLVELEVLTVHLKAQS